MSHEDNHVYTFKVSAPPKKGREPKHTLEQLLLKTVEGRKATPEERACALAAAFHTYCFKNELNAEQISADAYCSRGIIYSAGNLFDKASVEEDMPLLANAPKYLGAFDDEGNPR